MTLSASLLTSGSDSTDGAAVATASISPGANKDLLIAIAVGNTATVTPTQPTVTGLSLTWTLVDGYAYDTSGATRHGLWVFTARTGASPGSGVVTVTFPQTNHSFVWSVLELDGSLAVRSTVKGTVNPSAATNPSVNWPFGTPFDQNARQIAFWAHEAAEAATPEWTELSDDSVSTPSQALEAQWTDDHSDNSMGGTSWSTSSVYGVVGIEIQTDWPHPSEVDCYADVGIVTIQGPQVVQPAVVAAVVAIGAPTVTVGEGASVAVPEPVEAFVFVFTPRITGATGPIPPPGPPPPGEPSFTLWTTDIKGLDLVRIPISTLDYGFILDDAGPCTFDVPLHHPDVTQDTLGILKRDVWVYEEGELRWGGRLWDYSADTRGEGKVSFIAKNWFELMKFRYVRPPYELKFGAEFDFWDLLWEIFNYANRQRHVGFTRGFNQWGVQTQLPRNYPYFEKASLADICVTIAETHGFWFDFWVDPDKVVRTRSRPGAVQSSPTFEVGTVARLAVEQAGDDVATQVFTSGFGSGRALHWGEAHRSAYYNTYGLMQAWWDRPGTCQRQFLDQYADAFVRRHLRPTIQITDVEAQGDVMELELGLGLRYPLLYQDGYIDVDDDVRLVARSVHWEKEGVKKGTFFFDSNLEYQVH